MPLTKKQKKLDVNKDGKITGMDFKMLRRKRKTKGTMLKRKAKKPKTMKKKAKKPKTRVVRVKRRVMGGGY